MALTKEQSAQLAALGFDVEKLTAAIKAPGEVAIEIPAGSLFTEDVLTSRDATMREEGLKEGKTLGFKEGKDKGLEIAGSAILKKFNLDPLKVNAKDPDRVTEAIHNAAATGDAGLQEQIKLLQQEIDKYSRELTEKERAYEVAKFDSTLITNLPLKRNGKLMSDEEFLLTLKSNLQFENNDGVMVVKKGNEILRHPTTKAPLPMKDAIEAYFNDRKWIESEQAVPINGGRGGGDKPLDGTAAGVRTASQFEAKWKAENPGKVYGKPDSVVALREAAAAAGPGNFDYNS
jgi:hypothetical protein